MENFVELVSKQAQSLLSIAITHQTRAFRITPSENDTRQTLEKTEGQSLLGTPGGHIE